MAAASTPAAPALLRIIGEGPNVKLLLLSLLSLLSFTGVVDGPSGLAAVDSMN